MITLKKLTTLQSHKGSVNSISFNYNGRILASGSNDGTIRLWNMDTFKEIINPIYIGREIHSVSFNNGNILACGL